MSSNKPFPSSDLDVFKENSLILDNFVNSQENEYPDRFGRKRPTITGIIKEVFNVRTDISNMNETLIGQSRWDAVPKNTSLSLGGDNGALNKQAQALFNRTEMLKVHAREALRRTYLESGLNLVEGSFEQGANITSTTDVVLHEKTGKCYSGPIGNVPKGTSPLSEEFVDKSDVITKGGSGGYSYIRGYKGVAGTISVYGREIPGDGGAGVFDKDDTDKTTPDDDCTVIVSVTGARWKRRLTGNVVNVLWAGAKPNEPLSDSTTAFKNAMKAVYRLGKTLTTEWPNNSRSVLTGPGGDYYFSAGFIVPEFSAPNFVNYDILMPDSTFRPLSTYDLRFPLIHARACFEYTWEFGVSGFQSKNGSNDTMYVIFNDSGRENNYGGKCSYKIKAADTEYVIRHELESVVAKFDGCMTNKNVKRFLRVWRCDQGSMDGCFFNWEQGGRSKYDSFIQWGLDDGVTNEPNYPGNGNYNVGRLTVTNSAFIPNGTDVPLVHTGWFENIGGVIQIKDGCHFGPESNNRPSVVLNKAQGATFSQLTDLTESGIYIDGVSCASSWDLVYCITDYPNVISIKNIRWNTLDYSNGEKLTYLIGGNAVTLNAKTEKYSRFKRSHFHFICEPGAPTWKGLNDVDPALVFANAVVTRQEVPYGLATWNTLPNSTIVYDIQNRDGLMPAVPDAGVYELTNTYSINSTSENKLVSVSSCHRVSLVKNGENMELVVTPLVTPPTSAIGITPTLTAVFVNPSNTEVNSAPKLGINSGAAYFIRFKYSTNSSTNLFVDEQIRIKRIA